MESGVTNANNFSFIEAHINQLIKIGDDTYTYTGNNSFDWAKCVLNQDQVNPNLNTEFNRGKLFEYSLDPENTDLDCTAATFSWGGMRRNHGRRVLKKDVILLELVSNLRRGLYKSRKDAFQSFQQARDQGNLSGLGIGFFTKLICFLAQDLNGYIMDQWASKSVNLLTGSEIVKIDKSGWVTDKNSPDNYEIYCSIIDSLGQQMNCSGLKAEERIFSLGHGKGKWRNYLKINY